MIPVKPIHLSLPKDWSVFIHSFNKHYPFYCVANKIIRRKSLNIFCHDFCHGFKFFFFFFSSSSLFWEDWNAFQAEGPSESRRASILWELLSIWQRRWVSFWRKLLQPELCSTYQRQVGFCPLSIYKMSFRVQGPGAWE